MHGENIHAQTHHYVIMHAASSKFNCVQSNKIPSLKFLVQSDEAGEVHFLLRRQGYSVD